MTNDNNPPKNKPPVIAIVIGIIVIAGVALFMNMGSIVKTMAEKIGTKTMGVPVKIAAIDISATDKSITVSGLKIGNASGFSQAQSIMIGTIKVAADSLSKDNLVFNEVTVSDTDLYLEVTEKGINLNKIFENLKSNDKVKTAQNKEATAQDEGEAIKVAIKSFNLTNANLHASSPFLSGDVKPVTMPDIVMKNIGDQTKPVSVTVATSKIMEKVISVAMKTSAKSGMLEGIGEDQLKDVVGNFDISKSSLSKSLGEDLNKAKDSLKSLFGN